MAIRTYASGGQVGMLDKMDKSALIPMADNDPQRWTYSYAATGIVLPANATDILQIQGAANKRTVIRALILSGSATAAQNIPFQLVHRSALSTGGTPSNPTLHKRDSNDPNPGSVLTLFAGVPAVGAVLGGNSGVAEAGRLNVAPANNGAVDRWINQYTWQNEKGIILNGSGEFLSLFIPGANLPVANAPVLDISLILTEEAL